MKIKELYSILGLPEGASAQEVIKTARKLMAQNHPDRGGDENKYKIILNAKDDLLKYLDDAVRMPEKKEAPQESKATFSPQVQKMASKIREFILSLPESERSPFTKSPEIFSESISKYISSNFEDQDAKFHFKMMILQILKKHSGVVKNWGKFKQLIIDSLPTSDEQVISLISKAMEEEFKEFKGKMPEPELKLTNQEKIAKAIRDFILALPESERSPFTQSPEIFAESILAFIKSNMEDSSEKYESERMIFQMLKKHSGISKNWDKFRQMIIDLIPGDERVFSSVNLMLTRNKAAYDIYGPIFIEVLKKISLNIRAGIAPDIIQHNAVEIAMSIAKASVGVVTLERLRDLEHSIKLRFHEVNPDLYEGEEFFKFVKGLINSLRNPLKSTSQYLKSVASEYNGDKNLLARLKILVTKNSDIRFDYQDSIFIRDEIHNLCEGLKIPLSVENKIMSQLTNLHRDVLPERN